MFQRLKSGIRFANVVSVIALCVALSGGAYAAIKLPNNSVKAKNIKPGAVKTAKIADGAVTSPKVADGAVTSPKFAADAVAPDAAKFGGVAPGGCQTGWIKGSVVINTTGLPADQLYHTVAGFNCGGGEVQVRRTALTGTFVVKFVGGAGGSGSCLGTGGQPQAPLTNADLVDVVCEATTDGGAPAFSVGVRSQAVGLATGNQLWTLLAF